MEIEGRRLKKSTAWRPVLYGADGRKIGEKVEPIIYDAKGRPILKKIVPVASAKELESALLRHEAGERIKKVKLTPAEVKALQSLAVSGQQKVGKSILNPDAALVERANSMVALQEFTAKSVKEAERLQKWRKDLVRQVRKREKGIVV